jgi:hypothetical protein
MLVLEVAQDSVDFQLLSNMQKLATDGVFARVMASYIQWLSSKLDSIDYDKKFEILRRNALRINSHSRTPDIVASLQIGLETFLQFAHEKGAVLKDEHVKLKERVSKGIEKTAGKQKYYLSEQDETSRFLRLVNAAISSGSAHLVNAKGGQPDECHLYGWDCNNSVFIPKGTKIGWIDGDELMLHPEATFKVAQEFGRSQGDPLKVTKNTLLKRLREKGITSKFEKGKNVTRRSVEGKREYVLLFSNSREIIEIDCSSSDVLESEKKKGACILLTPVRV